MTKQSTSQKTVTSTFRQFQSSTYIHTCSEILRCCIEISHKGQRNWMLRQEAGASSRRQYLHKIQRASLILDKYGFGFGMKSKEQFVSASHSSGPAISTDDKTVQI